MIASTGPPVPMDPIEHQENRGCDHSSQDNFTTERAARWGSTNIQYKCH